MPSYRVADRQIEVSPNNRAGCQDAVCKKNSDKIVKGEIRFGVWVEGTSAAGHEFQSWKWRHWGCVSGKTLQNVRENLSGSLANEREYQWDDMDGLEDMPPDYQEKFKSAVTEGKIADEDWKGDPAYNVLGKTGIRGRTPRKSKETETNEEDAESLAAAETPSKPVAKKRSRVKDEEEDEEIQPAKRRAGKAKKENDGDEDGETKLAKKRTSKAKIEADDGNDIKLAKKPTVKDSAKEKEEEEDESKAKKPIKKSRARKGNVKQESAEEDRKLQIQQGEKAKFDVKPAKIPRARRGAKKEEDTEFKGNESEENYEGSIGVKQAKKLRDTKSIKKEHFDEDPVKKEDSEDAELDIKPAKPNKGKEAVGKVEDDDYSITKKEENEYGATDVKSEVKNVKDETLSDWKEGRDEKRKTKPGKAALSDLESAKEKNNVEMPEDPLEQIALAFCDRSGPLVSDFNEMVEAQEVGDDDWEGFLQKKFRSIVDAGEIAGNDFNGFLQMMHERELASKEPGPVESKKGRKGRSASTIAKKTRAR